MKYFFLLILTVSMLYAETVIVNINPKQVTTTSQFSIGVTHTHGFWEFGNEDAVEQARDLLVDGIVYQNQHIMGWGVGNPSPNPGEFYWNDLDRRVDLMRSIDTPMFITFCQAPGWMKGTDDWQMDEEVLDEYIADFAELCMMVAERFNDVEFFQIWNEMKGYWSSSLNNWDYIRYTELYNAVYNAVKDVRPDAKLGGPYVVIQGDGATEIGKSGRDTFVPMGSKDKKIIEYWLENKAGADFICMDYSLIDYHDDNSYTHDEKMQLVPMWGEWIRDVRELTDLPIIISEFYGGADVDDLEFTAANFAACFRQALINGVSTALQWNPEQGELDHYLFTDTQAEDGGAPTPLYDVVKMYNDFFGPGTQIVASTSSSEWLDVLASADKTLLVNKKDELIDVNVDGESKSLHPYEVLLMDTPSTSGVQESHSGEQSELRYRAAHSNELVLHAAHSANVSVSVYNVLGQKIQTLHYFVHEKTDNVISPFKNLIAANGYYFVRITGLEHALVQQVNYRR